jgi:hypothetical protein
MANHRQHRSHSEVFNEAAAGVLAAIYDRHPIPYSFALKDAFPGVSELEVPIYGATIHWLIDEGFLRANRDATCPGKDFLDVRLSLKGLVVLNQVPSDLVEGQSKSLGDKIIDEVKKGAFAAAGELVKTALSFLALNIAGKQ